MYGLNSDTNTSDVFREGPSLYLQIISMATGIPYFDDIRCKPEVIDPPQDEDSTDVGELSSEPMQNTLKPNVAVSSNVRELLECPVCLNAMYPPIHQV